jgi:hypothetical protein
MSLLPTTSGSNLADINTRLRSIEARLAALESNQFGLSPFGGSAPPPPPPPAGGGGGGGSGGRPYLAGSALQISGSRYPMTAAQHATYTEGIRRIMPPGTFGSAPSYVAQQAAALASGGNSAAATPFDSPPVGGNNSSASSALPARSGGNSATSNIGAVPGAPKSMGGRRKRNRKTQHRKRA